MRARITSLLIGFALLGCQSTNRLPDGSMLGVMTTQQLPLVQIDGKERRLAPGARIIGANNASITPNQVPANSKVRYRVDATGLVSHVWLLPPER
ncbi:MAG TPA: hypothetical protein VJU53_05585 [Burkholderiaceae bacterium]|nr:hypothetical protein [Burkholderiaceae bacterium]